MVNEQVLDYIKKQIERGVSQEEIKTNLRNVGWSEADINEALRLVSSVPSPSPSSLPSMTPSSFLEETPVQKSKINLAKIIIGIFIILLVGAGTALASRVWDPLWNPFRPAPEKVIEQMIKKMNEVKTLHSDINFEIDIRDEIAVYETEFNIKGNFQSDSDINDPKNPKSKAVLNGSFTMEDTEFSLGLETIEIGETAYIKITTLPLLFQPFLAIIGINFKQLENQWIKIDEESSKQFFKQFLGKEGEEEFEKLYGELKKEQEEKKKEQEMTIERFRKIIENKKLFIVKKKLADEKIRNKKAYHYLLALNNEEIKKVILELPGISDVFSPLSGVRTRAREARIISNMMQMRTAAEMIYGDKGGYRNVSCNYKDISKLCEDVEKQGATKPIIYSSKDDYCVFTSLPIKGYYYCIDSKFNAVTTNINPQETGYCDGQTFVCPAEVEILEEDYEKTAKEEFGKEFDKFFEEIGDITAEIWIGKKDNYLYKIKTEKEIDVSQFEETEKGKIIIKVDIELSNFNQPVQIEAPKEYKGFEEIFSSLRTEAEEYMNKAEEELDKVKIAFEKGEKLEIIKNYISNAIDYAKKATDLELYNPDLWFRRGNIYFELREKVAGSKEWALNFYEKALELDPTNQLYRQKVKDLTK